MEVDELIQSQVSKFQKISCNGGLQKASLQNPNRIEIENGINSGLQNQNLVFPVVDGGGDGGGGGGGGGGGWPSSRIVRVSRGSGGKDRHSKVLTSKGLRDRRIRLSVTTAIEFYDLQDRLGYDQPSKAVDWLIKAASGSISELPSLPPSFSSDNHHHYEKRFIIEDRNHQSKSPACSSTSETSKGSGLSLSRSENRILARDRARDRSTAAKQEKQEKEKEKVRVPLPTVMNTVNNGTGTSLQNSSFTYLLTGGINNANPSGSRIQWTSPTDANYFQNMSHVNINTESQHNHFPFQNYTLPLTTIGGDGRQSCYNLNSPIGSLSSSLSLSSRGGLASGSNRGTLQSNLLSMADGSASASFPLFVVPNTISGPPDHFVATEYESQRLQLYGRGDGRMRQSDQYKERSKD